MSSGYKIIENHSQDVNLSMTGCSLLTSLSNNDNNEVRIRLANKLNQIGVVEPLIDIIRRHIPSVLVMRIGFKPVLNLMLAEDLM